MLKEARTRAGLTQASLANLSGVSIKHIQKLEQGERDTDGLRIDKLVDLADAIGCKMTEIISPDLAEKLKKNLEAY